MSTSLRVDENGNLLSEIETEKAHAERIRDAVSVVYVTNPKGDILVQVREDGRKDHSAAGHVDPGEDYLEAAKRELKEELGIDAKELKHIGDAKTKEDGPALLHYFRIYTCAAEPGALDTQKVRKVFWADPFQVLLDMGPDVTDRYYTGGFKETLKTYLREAL